MCCRRSAGRSGARRCRTICGTNAQPASRCCSTASSPPTSMSAAIAGITCGSARRRASTCCSTTACGRASSCRNRRPIRCASATASAMPSGCARPRPSTGRAAMRWSSRMGGSMGTAAGEALVTAARLAVLQEAALIAVPASGGARMQEGVLSLMQMPRTILAVDMVKEAGLPYIVLLTDPTTGGVSASFAMVGDITLAEPGAIIGFAGARVIEETIREKLPPGFQRAEYLYEHGMVDQVVPRAELRATLARVIGLLREPAAGEAL